MSGADRQLLTVCEPCRCDRTILSNSLHSVDYKATIPYRRKAPSSTSCSNPAEDSCNSGRTGRVDLKNRTEKRRNRHVWMNCRVIRDREAPGSNPGPPTIFRLTEGAG